MRPAVVLVVLALALAGTAFKSQREAASFDNRFAEAERNVRELVQSIDAELESSSDQGKPQE